MWIRMVGSENSHDIMIFESSTCEEFSAFWHEYVLYLNEFWKSLKLQEPTNWGTGVTYPWKICELYPFSPVNYGSGSGSNFSDHFGSGSDFSCHCVSGSCSDHRFFPSNSLKNFNFFQTDVSMNFCDTTPKSIKEANRGSRPCLFSWIPNYFWLLFEHLNLWRGRIQWEENLN